MNPTGEALTSAHKVAFLFPGQGTQHIGMGRTLYEGSAAARSVFEEIDEALSVSLTRLMFDGPEDELTKTVNAQPAILAVSLACLKVMEEMLGAERIPEASFMAGHSLGEYTALVASEALSAQDAVRLVRERGRHMQDVSERLPGGMAAVVGLDELTVEEVCRETGAHISTVNADDQMVIGGDRVALARAMDLCSARGAKRLIRLQVSGAFHTDLMAPAAEGLAEAINGVRFHDPVVPVIANCNGRPLNTGKSVKAELVRQLSQCVQWRRSIDYMLQAGVEDFYEIGPGKVLSGLVKRIEPQASVVNVGDLETAQALAG